MVSLIGILLGLCLLIYLAYKGHSIIWVAPLCALVVAVMGGVNVLSAYLGDYMSGVAGYIISWFPAFFLGAVYGKIMDMTGSARSLANKLVSLIGARFAIAAVVIPCLLMTYGGISLFVVVFVILTVLIVVEYFKSPMPFTKFERWCIAAVYGGGLGNVIDRVFRGYVVDMLETKFMDFPVFNVADCFITCGCILLLVHIIFFNKNFWKEEKK